MLIIALDDEPLLLGDLIRAIRQAEPYSQVIGFTLPSAVVKEVSQKGLRPDVAFLDIELPGMSGIDLAKWLKNAIPDINIIFVTGFSNYAVDAANIYASGYVVKPVASGRIRREIDNLRHPVARSGSRRLRVQTFGNFEVFCGDEPVRFKYAKTKELFAYLIDRRGASINTSQLLGVLWEEEPDQPALRSYLRNLISDLASTLRDYGEQDVFVKSRNRFSINTSAVDCDLYRFLERDFQAISAYGGEYMSQYPWAEMTLGSLSDD